MNCTYCQLPLAPGEVICPNCGALAPAGQKTEGDGIPVDDSPTEVMPLVALPGAPVPPPTPAAAPQLERVPPPPEPPPATVAVREPARRGPAGRGVMLAALGGLAVVIVVAIAAIVVGGLGRSAPDAAQALDGDATMQPTRGATTGPVTQGGLGISCDARELASQTSGRWRLFRAEYGNRVSHDYLRLKLRRESNDGDAAALTAELLPPGDVAARYGIDGPQNADSALVIAFRGAVGIGGSWGASPGYRALRSFQVARSGEATVVVVGVRGEGCFGVSESGWTQGGDAAEITFEIERL